MEKINQNNLKGQLYSKLPIIVLFISVLNEMDFNTLGLKYFSFNFSFILIFYYSLKKSQSLGYGFIFIAGLFNDVVVGTPIGLSSFLYLLICGAAAYLRNITLRPNPMKDWFFFLLTILVVNSISFLILTFFFNYQINYYEKIVNIVFTFLIYLSFSFIFDFFEKNLFGKYNA